MVMPFHMSWAAHIQKSAALLCALMVMHVLGGCGGKSDTKVVLPPLPPPAPKAIIKTRFGEIEMKFHPELAPNHVENFIKLAKSGFYNGTIFHRVIPGFMIQGGDPNTKKPEDPGHPYGTGGNVENGKEVRLKAEFNDTSHKRGIVSMARSSDPNSASSQFFIVVKDSTFLDNQYSAFGEVIAGMEVADKIAAAPRGANDRPNQPIHIKKVLLSQAKSTS